MVCFCGILWNCSGVPNLCELGECGIVYLEEQLRVVGSSQLKSNIRKIEEFSSMCKLASRELYT